MKVAVPHLDVVLLAYAVIPLIDHLLLLLGGGNGQGEPAATQGGAVAVAYAGCLASCLKVA